MMKINHLYFIGVLILLVSCKSNESTPTPVEVVETPPKVIYIPKYDYDSTEWLDLRDLDTTIVMDIRYATDSNFVGETMYECGRCFLRKEVALAVVEAHHTLQKKGLGLKMYDCYRPRPIQQKLWDKVPDARYVAKPSRGSMHNRGAAVDLTIVDSLGNELEMGTAYDFFGIEAYHRYKDHSDTIEQNRQLLLNLMADYGLKPTPTEWWHYSYRKKSYALSDMLWNCE